MRFGNGPAALQGRFVGIQAQVSLPADFFERAGEIQVGRGAINRVAAQDDQRFHFARVHVGDQFAQRLRLVDRVAFDRVGVADGLADIAERRVHGVRQRVNGWRLIIARDHQAVAFVSLQVLGDGRNFLVFSAGLAARADPGREVPRPDFDFAGREHEEMIRHAGRRAGSRLHHIEPVQRGFGGRFAFRLHLGP